MKAFRFFPLLLVFVAGCSVFPGLRVLTGEDTGNAPAVVQQAAELVMADKSGATDPSLIAAADRIEAANRPNVDIIEIRKDTTDDKFVVNMLFQSPADANDQTQAAMISQYTAVQRALEVTWQGTLRESEGTGVIEVNFIAPLGVPTLDSGTSFVGFMMFNSSIDRSEAISYLSGPRDLNDFLDLIANGKLHLDSAQNGEIYSGHPNHPLFMLSAAADAAQNASGESTNAGGTSS